MSTDKQAAATTQLDSPATKHFVVTPSSTELTILPRALYIGTSGDLVIEDINGLEVTYVSVSGILPIRCTKVLATTTASNIVALY